MSNEAWIESWLLALHDRSPGTRDQYRRNLGYFERWLTTRASNDADEVRTSSGQPRGGPWSPPIDLLAVTRRDVEAWFAAQAEAGIAQNTRRARWVSLRSFYTWLVDEDELDTNPMAKVRVARPGENPPPVITLEELRRLLKVCEGKGFAERRDLALLRVFVATGCRLNEVAGMTVADLDLASRLVHVMGKGSRPRVVRFDAATAAALDRYKRTRGRHKAHSKPWLWLGTKGQLTKSGIDTALRRRAAQAGIKGFHAHLLRHTWADLWKSRGGSEGDLMRLGGWQDPAVMRRYGAARAVDRALSAYDVIDPLADL